LHGRLPPRFGFQGQLTVFPTIPDKTFFKIGEAATLAGVKPYIIRYWESEFRALKPSKTKSQQRLFRQKDIELLLVIRTLLYEHKFTTEGARQKLKELSDAGRTPRDILEQLALGEIPTVQNAPLIDVAVETKNESDQLRDELAQANDRLALQKRKLDDIIELLRRERASSAEALTESTAALASLRSQLAERDATIATLQAQQRDGGDVIRARARASIAAIAERLAR
jgi:DNA-binding transcriptional MerR regulator